MVELTILVCDVDRDPSNQDTVRHYSVTVGGETVEADLCDKHAGLFAPGALQKAIEDRALGRGPGRPRKAPSATPRASSGGPRRKVTTLAEIEAMKS